MAGQGAYPFASSWLRPRYRRFQAGPILHNTIDFGNGNTDNTTIWNTWFWGASGTTLSPPQLAWVWSPHAAVLSFALSPPQKAWLWSGNAGTIAKSIVSVQKAWLWSGNAGLLTTTITGAQKAWAWTVGTPTIASVLSAAQKTWNWTGNSAILTGTGLAAAKIIRAAIVRVGFLLTR